MTIARNAIFQLLQDESNYLEELHGADIQKIPHKLLIQVHEYARLKAQMAQQQQQRQHSLDGRGLAYMAGKNDGGLESTSLDMAVRLSQHPALVYTYLNYKWAIGERRDALQMIETFARGYSSKVGFDLQAPEAFADHIDARVLESYNGHMGVADDSKTIHFLSRFYFKRAEWLAKIEQQHLLVQEARTKAGLGHRDELHSLRQNNRASTNARRSVRGSASACSGANGAIMASSSGVALAGDRGSQMDKDCEYLYKLKGDRIKEMILESYHAATVLDSKWYKAWHSLALRHFFETQQYSEEHSSVTEDIIEKHVVPAVDGFFRAIQLSKGDTTLQDTLRLLTAWFNYSKYER
ncbi:phosphatidylinositol kinase- protein kinase tor1, partial [Coemansia aciculifera]